MNATALTFESVSRVFSSASGSRVAVDSLDLTLSRGEILGLLGPNGAGKTTTVKMAATLLEPSAGSITVAGVDAARYPRKARENTGLVLGGDRGFYMRATARENLRFFAELQGVSGRRRNARVEEVLKTVGLTDRQNDKVEAFSRGMRQRLHIARALVNEPTVVLLDEPSIGLDPEAARDLRELAASLREFGCGILLTTHYMSEAEQLADRLLIFDAGRVVAEGTVKEIATAAGMFAVTSYRADVFDAESRAVVCARTDVLTATAHTSVGSAFVDVTWSSPNASEAAVAEVRQALVGAETIGTRDATLEEAYLALLSTGTGRSGQDSE